MDFEYVYSSSQFEDDSNTRVLNSSGIANIFSSFLITESTSIYLSLENIFNKRSQAGISKDGLITYGPPRFLLLGIKLRR